MPNNYWETYALEHISPAFQEWFDTERTYLPKKIWWPEGDSLDIGCGTGRTITNLLGYGEGKIIGIDADKALVNKTRKHFKNYKNVKIKHGEASSLPFEDISFQKVLCMATLGNLGEQKQKAIQEIARVVWCTGQVFISVYSENAFNERIQLYKKAGIPIKKVEGSTVYFNPPSIETISEQFTLSQIEELVEPCGLKINDHVETQIAHICKLSKA